MRVECEHGFFRFYPSYSDEVFVFNDYFNETLEWDGKFFTFPLLKTAPKYSLVGKTYLGLTATKTFEGTQAMVFRENELVYDLENEEMVFLNSVSTDIELIPVNGEFLAPSSLVQPGCFVSSKRLLSYAGVLDIGVGELRIAAVEYA